VTDTQNKNPSIWSGFPTYPDNDAAASNHLTGFALLVDLAETSPFAQFLVVINLDEVDSVFAAESLHKLHVHGLITVVSKDAKVSLSLVQSLSALIQTTSKTIMDE
jgi:hypothetical protein